MKVVLLPLSGSQDRPVDYLRSRFPAAEVELFPRSRLESGSLANRVAALRERRPDIFAVSTESLRFQWGQDAFLLFGALAGAQRLIVLDCRGSIRDEHRAGVFLAAPFRLMREVLVSAITIVRAYLRLQKLQRLTRAKRFARPLVFQPRAKSPAIIYLRTIPAPGTQSGGATSHLNGVVNALADKGARVQLISNDQIAGLQEAKIPLRLVRVKPAGATRTVFDLYNSVRFAAEATRMLLDDPPDFIYERYSRFSWAGVQSSRDTGRPLFLEYNGSEVWMGQHWGRGGLLELLKLCERLNLEAATRIFVVSEIERRNLLEAGVAESKIVVNQNGVDPEEFKPGVGGAIELEQFEIGKDEILFGFLSTFGPWHGVLTLAEAITLMPPDLPARFLLIGDGSLRPAVEQILQQAGARAIFTGMVPHERVPALLDACDILVSPHVPLADSSEFFGSPTKLFEYMAMGKGIVASRLGQIGDVLSHEETALLVEPGRAPELRDAMVRLAQSPELCERLGKAARLAAIENHTWSRNADRVLQTYRSWLASESADPT
jgi:glycosyltransferase involved in cell wall biosynthesis